MTEITQRGDQSLPVTSARHANEVLVTVGRDSIGTVALCFFIDSQ